MEKVYSDKFKYRQSKKNETSRHGSNGNDVSNGGYGFFFKVKCP